ncbi:CRTAC1 family protein [Bremerella sp.]|uniref:CRTAC1 family protein n=1 Tax=Bremerella sp. TaxID=2795602 RepID=UPI00391BB639
MKLALYAVPLGMVCLLGCTSEPSPDPGPSTAPPFVSNEPRRDLTNTGVASTGMLPQKTIGSQGTPVGSEPQAAVPISEELPPIECDIRLVDVTATSGITFRHNDGGSGEGYIVEAGTAGLALFDYDLDGFIDIYFVNGAPLRGTEAKEPVKNALYRNNGDWTFTDVTEEAGVGDTGHGMGVTAGDYDNDGDEDLYINNFGPNVLYRNNGDGTFSDVTQASGTENGDQLGAGACFFDMDRDGDLDLYVGNYVNFNYDNHVPIEIDSHFFKAGPQYYKPVPDTLYRNNGDGTFTDVSDESGVGKLAGPSMGILSTDYDEDGDLDVFVCNDNETNYLWQNDGQGVFKEMALLVGVANDFYGKSNASMGVDAGDYDNDGHIDLFITDWQSEMPVLYRNLGGGLFEDATNAARLTRELFPHVHWGTSFVDFDNDGDLDLFVACGHFDEIERIDDRTAKRVQNYLLMNQGDGTFVDVSKLCGDGLAIVESSRGAGFDDLDNDGDIDAVILNSSAPPSILRNESKTNNNWVQVELTAPQGNRFGVGSRVTVVAGGRQQCAEVYSGRGYQSQYGRRIHFGLGDQNQIDRVDVRWPDGTTSTVKDLKVNERSLLSREP